MNKHDSLPFEDHFSLSSGDLQKILNTALIQGGDFSEIFLEYRVFSSINMEEDIIKETSENIMLGAGIRAVYGDQTGYGYTNDLSLEKVTRAALTASSIVKGFPSQKSLSFQSTPVLANYYPILNPAQDESLENKISLVKATYQSALKFDRKIKKVKVSFIDQTRYITIANSEGQNLSDVQPLVKMSCLCIAEKANKREAGFSGGGGRVGLE
jgi:TldD protein